MQEITILKLEVSHLADNDSLRMMTLKFVQYFQNTETSSASIQVPATQATTTETILSTPCNGDESSLASNRYSRKMLTFK